MLSSRITKRYGRGFGAPFIALSLLVCVIGVVGLILYISPTPGYDTSSRSRFIRWDAVHITYLASRPVGEPRPYDYLHAASFAYPYILRKISDALSLSLPMSAVLVNLTGRLISFPAAYFIAYSFRLNPWLVIGLFSLLPAGVFLLAPYAESLFACVHIVAYALYVHYRQNTQTFFNPISSPNSPQASLPTLMRVKWFSMIIWPLLVSSLIMSLATLLRFNGILSLLIYPFDVLNLLLIRTWGVHYNMNNPHLSKSLWEMVVPSKSLPILLYLAVMVTLFVAPMLAILYPQYLAWLEYCSGTELLSVQPEWCFKFPRLIYPYIQAKYWNVGFLRYWTLANLALFAISAPQLLILIFSSIHYLRRYIRLVFLPIIRDLDVIGHVKCYLSTSYFTTRQHRWQDCQRRRTVYAGEVKSEDIQMMNSAILLAALSIPQLILALIALFSFHVQIIIRLASAYPVWILYLSEHWTLLNEKIALSRSWRNYHIWWPRACVAWMVGHIIVQSALYAAYLPPA